MGNRSKGVRWESRNVGARCPERNSFAEAQSLKSSPALRSGFCSPAIANEPKATIGVSLSSSRRLRALNLRGSVDMGLNPRNTNNISKIPEPEKCYVETEKLPSGIIRFSQKAGSVGMAGRGAPISQLSSTALHCAEEGCQFPGFVG